MTQYFSEAVFKPGSPADWRDLASLNSDVDVQHKALWRLFARPPGTPRPFVYRQRIDDTASGERSARFWLLSDAPPQSPDTRWQLRTKRYAPRFHNGQRLRFELRIAPSVSRVDPRRAVPAGKRVPPSTRFDPVALALMALPRELRAEERKRWVDEKLALWLRDKAARCGFTWADAADVTLVRYEPVTQARSRRENVRFSIADFSGELEVTDADAFTAAALQGVGHQRGFGCGLLLLKPVRARDDEEDD